MIVKLVILILSLSLNMNVILSADTVVKQQPTRHAFSYTDKSLDQLYQDQQNEPINSLLISLLILVCLKTQQVRSVKKRLLN